MGIKKVKKCSVRKIIFFTGLIRAAKAGQKSIVPARQANQGRPLSFVFFETPFTSNSTVSRVHPSQVSLS
jgi:hypothetical protein